VKHPMLLIRRIVFPLIKDMNRVLVSDGCKRLLVFVVVLLLELDFPFIRREC